jgi:hypothetical protein
MASAQQVAFLSNILQQIIIEMEIHEHNWDPLINTANLRWETLNYLKESNMADIHLELLWNCFNETIGKRILTRSPWEQAGWWTMCNRWVKEQLNKKDIKQTGHMYPLRINPNRITIYMESDIGILYFKASTDRFEASISCYLAGTKVWRKQLPAVIAFDTERRWVLTHEIIHRLSVEDNGDRDGEDEGEAVSIVISQCILRY